MNSSAFVEKKHVVVVKVDKFAVKDAASLTWSVGCHQEEVVPDR